MTSAIIRSNMGSLHGISIRAVSKILRVSYCTTEVQNPTATLKATCTGIAYFKSRNRVGILTVGPICV